MYDSTNDNIRQERGLRLRCTKEKTLEYFDLTNK